MVIVHRKAEITSLQSKIYLPPKSSVPSFAGSSLTRRIAKTVLTVGWIPMIIWIGYRNSNPQPSLMR